VNELPLRMAQAPVPAPQSDHDRHPQHQREALRQQMLLRALWRDARPGVVEGWLRDTPGAPARKRRGLQAYQANAGALAERALAAAFPTVQALLGDKPFAALARAFWHAQAPLDGDLANWGDGLPGFVGADPQLADEPYLGDVAAIDWAVHRAELADDDSAEVQGLQALAEHEPQALTLQLRAGWAVLSSPHPVHAIWAAHRSDDPDRFVPVRAALAQGLAQCVRVRRDGLRAVVELIDDTTARFEQQLLQRDTLATALAGTPPGFDFEAWFIDILRLGGLSAVTAS
jgi:hypothetical protein